MMYPPMRGLSTEELRIASLTPLGVDEHWGASQFQAILDHCDIIGAEEDIYSVIILPPDSRRRACGSWYFSYLICQRVPE